MDRYSVLDNNEHINSKFDKDDIVFDFMEEYEWSDETKKQLMLIKNKFLKKGNTFVKYFSQFSKQQIG